MTQLTDLVMPAWETLIGGSKEVDWYADRDRKFSAISEMVSRFNNLADQLDANNQIFSCSTQVLKELPGAADWYISLAGFSKKTLSNIKIAPAKFGLNRTAKGLVETLDKYHSTNPGHKTLTINDLDLDAFSKWINFEIRKLFPSEHERNKNTALSTVFMVLGGRVIGQGQNAGGDIAVDALKSLIVQGFKSRKREIKIQNDPGRANEELAPGQLSNWNRIVVADKLTFELLPGGNRPDIRIFNRNIEIAAGEVKGRKDESNIWESWMPGVHNHLRTWTREDVDRARLFFGTLITESMITGITTSGTQHTGLESMKNQGLLTSAFNISKIIEGDRDSVNHFNRFIDLLDSMI